MCIKNLPYLSTSLSWRSSLSTPGESDTSRGAVPYFFSMRDGLFYTTHVLFAWSGAPYQAGAWPKWSVALLRRSKWLVKIQNVSIITKGLTLLEKMFVARDTPWLQEKYTYEFYMLQYNSSLSMLTIMYFSIDNLLIERLVTRFFLYITFQK